MKAQPAPTSRSSRYLGVFCINPTCGQPMDVGEAWPPDTSRYNATTHHQSICTVECPHCDRRSTYHPKEVRELQGGDPGFR